MCKRTGGEAIASTRPYLLVRFSYREESIPRRLADLARTIIGAGFDIVATGGSARIVADAGLPVHDTFTPYAVHGLDAAQKLPRSKLTFVCGAGGALGLSGAGGLVLPLVVAAQPHRRQQAPVRQKVERRQLLRQHGGDRGPRFSIICGGDATKPAR